MSKNIINIAMVNYNLEYFITIQSDCFSWEDIEVKRKWTLWKIQQRRGSKHKGMKKKIDFICSIKTVNLL